MTYHLIDKETLKKLLFLATTKEQTDILFGLPKAADGAIPIPSSFYGGTWNVDEDLVYRLNEHENNRDEIRISQANGSRSMVERSKVALQVKEMLTAANGGNKKRDVVYVHVTAVVKKSKLHAYDKKIAGVYGVNLKSTCPIDGCANAALDAFHGNYAIKVLDDFSISVQEGSETDSVEIHQSESYENDELLHHAGDVFVT